MESKKNTRDEDQLCVLCGSGEYGAYIANLFYCYVCVDNQEYTNKKKHEEAELYGDD